MRAKFPPIHSPSDLKLLLGQWLRTLRSQSWLVLASYACGLIGVRLTIYDFHHYRPWKFGLSTPFLGAAILLYVLGQRRLPRKR